MACANVVLDNDLDPLGDGSLRHSYRFEDYSNEQSTDSFSSANTSLISGSVGKYISVADNGISSTANGHGFAGDQDLSFCFWNKVGLGGTVGEVGQLSFGGDGARYNAQVVRSATLTYGRTEFQFYLHKAGVQITVPAINYAYNEWVHIAYTYEMATQTSRVYVNGALHGSATLQMKWLDNPIDIDATPIVVGSMDVDQLTTFTKTLSQPEIELLMNTKFGDSPYACLSGESTLVATGTRIANGENVYQSPSSLYLFPFNEDYNSHTTEERVFTLTSGTASLNSAGKFGKCLEINGTITNTGLYADRTGHYIPQFISFWYKPTVYTNGTVLSFEGTYISNTKYGLNVKFIWLADFLEVHLLDYYNGWEKIKSWHKSLIPTGEFTHLIFQYEYKAGGLLDWATYKNGVLDGWIDDMASKYGGQIATDTRTIGSGTGTEYFDQMRIGSIWLSQEQIDGLQDENNEHLLPILRGEAWVDAVGTRIFNGIDVKDIFGDGSCICFIPFETDYKDSDDTYGFAYNLGTISLEDGGALGTDKKFFSNIGDIVPVTHPLMAGSGASREFALSLWMQVPSYPTDYKYPFYMQTSGVNGLELSGLWNNTGYFSFRCVVNGVQNSIPLPLMDFTTSLVHLVVNSKFGITTVHADGVLVSTKIHAGFYLDTSDFNSFYIGNGNQGNPTYLDHIRMFNRAITDEEIVVLGIEDYTIYLQNDPIAHLTGSAILTGTGTKARVQITHLTGSAVLDATGTKRLDTTFIAPNQVLTTSVNTHVVLTPITGQSSLFGTAILAGTAHKHIRALPDSVNVPIIVNDPIVYPLDVIVEPSSVVATVVINGVTFACNAPTIVNSIADSYVLANVAHWQYPEKLSNLIDESFDTARVQNYVNGGFSIWTFNIDDTKPHILRSKFATGYEFPLSHAIVKYRLDDSAETIMLDRYLNTIESFTRNDAIPLGTSKVEVMIALEESNGIIDFNDIFIKEYSHFCDALVLPNTVTSNIIVNQADAFQTQPTVAMQITANDPTFIYISPKELTTSFNVVQEVEVKNSLDIFDIIQEVELPIELQVGQIIRRTNI